MGNTKDQAVGPAVTSELFRQWRAPRFGSGNPERMNNPVWEWLVRSKISAYMAADKLGEPSALVAGPGWCFQRFGQSVTELPDGRTVLIAGEHEDGYDPDFYIYNDVVVLHPDGKMDIFGYAPEFFPPTDFHSATLVDNHIIIIGNLGYPDRRKAGITPVFALDLATFAVSPVQTSGQSPGWIHGHESVLDAGGASIIVRGGKLDRSDCESSLVENIDDWRLYLGDWRWERLTERRWQRWEITRKDGDPNHLWQFRLAACWRGVELPKELEKQLRDLVQDLGAAPDLDLWDKLFCPPVPHEKMPANDDEHGVTRIKIEGVIVRYVEDMRTVQMTVEGDLPESLTETLAADLDEKITRLENVPCEVKRL